MVGAIRYGPLERDDLLEHPQPDNQRPTGKARPITQFIEQVPEEICIPQHMPQKPPGIGDEAPGPRDAEQLVDGVDGLHPVDVRQRVRSLITDAQQLLGHVLRDRALLQDLLGELGDRFGFPRGALVVGLGMLEGVVTFEQAVPDESDHDAAVAWALAVILANWEEAEEVIKEGRQEASGAAQRVLETALRRVRSGYVISTVG